MSGRRGSARPRFPCFFFNDTATTEIYTLSLHDALPISPGRGASARADGRLSRPRISHCDERFERSEEHTSELQSQSNLVCRLLLEKKQPRAPANRVVAAMPPEERRLLVTPVHQFYGTIG